MSVTQATNLVLILARDLAVNLATPIFVVNPQGTLVYFNEPAEEILGRSYSEVGPLSPAEWGTMWDPRDDAGNSIAVDDLPLAIALAERRPVHQSLTIRSPDESDAAIEVTAIPLFARADEIVGAIAIFWEHSEKKSAV